MSEMRPTWSFACSARDPQMPSSVQLKPIDTIGGKQPDRFRALRYRERPFASYRVTERRAFRDQGPKARRFGKLDLARYVGPGRVQPASISDSAADALASACAAAAGR